MTPTRITKPLNLCLLELGENLVLLEIFKSPFSRVFKTWNGKRNKTENGKYDIQESSTDILIK